jgi:hypothetical protein
MAEASGRENGSFTLLRGLAVALGLIVTLAVMALLGFWRMFSVLPAYDDEGCMLITLEQFRRGHALYDEVFSMYGPFPLLVRWGLFAIAGQPVGHDVGRLFSVGFWWLTAVTCAFAAWRMARGSRFAGYASLVLNFLLLWLAIFEAGHPQEICGLLLALAVVLAVGAGRPATAAGLGAVAACLAMTKINVFAFLMMALVVTALAFTRPTRAVRAATFLACLGVLAAPGLLMRPHLGDPSIRAFALHVTLALVPPLVLGFGRRRPVLITVRHLAGFAGGFAITAALIALVVLARGTTPRGLVDGVLLNPLRVGTLYIQTVDWYEGRWPLALASVLGALAWVGFLRARLEARSRQLPAWVSAGFRVGYGVLMLGRVVSSEHNAYEGLAVLSLPWTALLLLQRDVDVDVDVDADAGPGVAAGPSGGAAARLFLALLAVTETLWAYPVAGSHRAYACFLPALALVLILVDGCQDLAQLLALEASATGRTVARLVRAAVLALVFTDLVTEADTARKYYGERSPLGLTGAAWIRLDPRMVYHYRRLTSALLEQPDTFLTMPGMYSLHFWTGRSPLTTFNLTNWMVILDDERQARIAAALAARPVACVVVDPDLIDFWMQGRPSPQTPLVRYIHANFRPSTKIDHREIWVRARATGPRP